ncbi:MAG: ATP-dependent acyl-CoA ligase [marine bacterium B5-7]|nr:MAG: ATP-dependent acyl-CoA ligase [marine bacterium B5-7]
METSLNRDNRYDHSRWSIAHVIEHQSIVRSKQVFITCEDESLTYGQAYSDAGRVSNYLALNGAEVGDPVAVMLQNGLEFCRIWLGLARLGAVHVAVNTDYLGRFLVHVLNNCEARLIIVDASYLERIADIVDELHYVKKILIVDSNVSSPSIDLNTRFDFTIPRSRGVIEIDIFSKWRQCNDTIDFEPPTYKDVGCVMYTSGTTGPSKGVLMPHAHLYLFGLGTIEHFQLDENDVFYIVLPLFHANGLFMQLYATLIAGARAIIKRRFSASAWLSDIVKYQATATNSLGAVAAFVLDQPLGDMDKKHNLRVMGLAPVSASLEERLKERFAISRIVGLYGMTEINIPLYTHVDVDKPNSCGRVWDRYYELMIVDPVTDEQRKSGEVGEIVVRPKQPFGFMSGYLNMPDKTVEAWRNFWFHTGDAAWMDDDGDVFFVDRIKDCIRRRGENISSFEVENAIADFPGIREVAAYAVSSSIEGTEDEVMVAVVGDEENIDVDAIREYLASQLPSFAIPRYIRLMSELPKTPTGKIQKHLLRQQAITEDTRDYAKS